MSEQVTGAELLIEALKKNDLKMFMVLLEFQ